MKIFQLLSMAMSEIPRLLPLLRDSRVPMWSKVVAGAIAALVISPLDLLGDIPILGFLDDGALLLFVLHTFVSFAEKSIA